MLGLGLWFIMQIVVLPILRWGVFGMNQIPAIAVTRLILHLVYGATLGGILDRGTAPSEEAHASSVDVTGATRVR
jgi:hypothetical protein